MEYLNKVELQGIVGSCRIQEVDGAKIANISIATEQHYSDSQGYYMIEVVWHNVRVIESDDCPDLESITKGTKLYVLGRLHSRRYLDQDGNNKSIPEIIAHKVMIIN